MLMALTATSPVPPRTTKAGGTWWYCWSNHRLIHPSGTRQQRARVARVAQLATLKAKDGACRESSSNFLRLKQAEFSSRSRDIIEKPTWWPDRLVMLRKLTTWEARVKGQRTSMTYHPSCSNILILKKGAPMYFLIPFPPKHPNFTHTLLSGA